jgi:hypothetical protein
MIAILFCVFAEFLVFTGTCVWRSHTPPKNHPLQSFHSPRALKISPTELSAPLSDTLFCGFFFGEPVRVCTTHGQKQQK